MLVYFHRGHYLRSAGHKAPLSQRQSGLLLYLSRRSSEGSPYVKPEGTSAHVKQESFLYKKKKEGTERALELRKQKKTFYLPPLSRGDA